MQRISFQNWHDCTGLVDHVVLTDNMADFAHIHRPEINLVACFLPPTRAFKQFAYSAFKAVLPRGAIFQHPDAPNTIAPTLEEQRIAIFNTIAQRYKDIEGCKTVIETLSRFADAYWQYSAEPRIRVTQFAHSRDSELPTMRLHIDPTTNIRGLVDLTDIGMLYFAQSGFSPQECRTLHNRFYDNRGDIPLSETLDYLNMHDDRVFIASGPVALMFKGNESENPLLHAAVPTSMKTKESARLPLRPNWRFDRIK